MPEVDSVLTSGEVLQLLEAHGKGLGDINCVPLDTLVPGVDDGGGLFGLPGGSGGCPLHPHSTASQFRPDLASALPSIICSGFFLFQT